MKKFARLASLGLTAVAMTAFAGVAAAAEPPARAVPAAPAPVAAQAAPVAVKTVPVIDDHDRGLKYVQSGRVVTITKGGAKVATVKLASATYAARSAKLVLSVQAARPFTINPALFTLYDAQGYEYDPKQTKRVRFAAGAGSLGLTFAGTSARPEAVGWVPRQDEEAVAVWERGQ
ncbi:hypothetical protein OWR29_01770 [Actinoplanes sp. Pm04-4]|uniref:Uncharacterized protein n=1 Tax=Paractinoplanes pyxinae TaxID=2997416 RepID=A0ABT4ATN9_9ACTN|nr:hypothetical protein [Actinoplanes pyxinae]MCY1136708.1 hypothetical protein [Actinoplanes pyxinae]